MPLRHSPCCGHEGVDREKHAMGKRAIGFQRRITQEAARIICEERITDYRQAKAKAAERLGFSAKSAMPDNAQVHEAVIEYQRLFGGREYSEHLQHLRRTALSAMRLLAEFQPRLVGAVATGATTDAHLVRLHGFADKPELLDVFLDSRRIPSATLSTFATRSSWNARR